MTRFDLAPSRQQVTS